MEGPAMKKLFRIQTDLFVTPTRPVELIAAERQKAVALLRALLTEALITRAGDPATCSKKKEAVDD
jgi:hypothetical protein